MSRVHYTNAERRAMMEGMLDSFEYRQSIKESDEGITEQEIDELLQRHHCVAYQWFEIDARIKKFEENKKIQDAMAEYHKKNTNEGTLITLCLDQDQSEEDALKNQYKVIDELRKANYKWMVEPCCVFEWWSKKDKLKDDMDNLNWNPHIHIVVRRIGKESKIRDNLKAKMKSLPSVYRFDVKRLPYENGMLYCSGEKVNCKVCACAKDEEFRNKHSVSKRIII